MNKTKILRFHTNIRPDTKNICPEYELIELDNCTIFIYEIKKYGFSFVHTTFWDSLYLEVY